MSSYFTLNKLCTNKISALTSNTKFIEVHSDIYNKYQCNYLDSNNINQIIYNSDTIDPSYKSLDNIEDININKSSFSPENNLIDDDYYNYYYADTFNDGKTPISYQSLHTTPPIQSTR